MELDIYDEIVEAQCQIIVNMRYIELSDISYRVIYQKKKVSLLGGDSVTWS
jgi:hypothetical protein